MNKIIITPISKQELQKYLEIKDLSTDSGGHVIEIIYKKVKEYLESTHSTSEIRECRLNPIVDVKDNYDRLLISKDNISRSSTYTHYVDTNRVLLTHTSAHIPGILSDLSKINDWEDVVLMIPGLVYRRDVTDRKHLSIIHHLDIWRVIKNTDNKVVKRTDLLQVINGLSEELTKGWKKRNVDKIHPYTLEGIEVNLVKDDQDIELLEGGVIHPTILKSANIDPNKHSGWAMGMGLDRLAMIIKEIPDIRYLRSGNPRIKAQMYDLNKYQEVSLMPAIKRDMSYCVPKDYVDEDIHNDIKKSIEEIENIVESIEVLKTISYKELAPMISEKIGCTKDLKNILVRITLRDLDKTLTKQEANDIYDRIYRKVNTSTKSPYRGI